jgi:hypothetical protein
MLSSWAGLIVSILPEMSLVNHKFLFLEENTPCAYFDFSNLIRNSLFPTERHSLADTSG